MKKLLVMMLVAVATFASAFTGAHISMLGGMDVRTGGTARVLSRVSLDGPVPMGYFSINFSQGEVRSARMFTFEEFSGNSFTAFLTGRGEIVLLRNGVATKVSGFFTLMVDDVDEDFPDFPDQFLMHFTADGTGEVFVRGGLMVRGNIDISL